MYAQKGLIPVSCKLQIKLNNLGLTTLPRVVQFLKNPEQNLKEKIYEDMIKKLSSQNTFLNM